MPDPFCVDAVAVCVPVKDEEALLPALLDALATQAWPRVKSAALCFLLDDCRDASASIVTAFAACSPIPVHIRAVSTSSPPNAGRARGGAMAIGQAALGDARCGVLLSTDADSVPAADWIAASCRSLADCDVVTGRIVRDGGAAGRQDRLEAYLDRLHALRRHHDPVPWEAGPTHHHAGGANMAFRASAYAALGGFAPLAAGEDGAIVDAAHRLGLRVRRDRTVIVHTSSRHHGRAVDGLADHLRALALGDLTPRVAHPDDAVWQYRGHALARAAFAQRQDPATAARLAAALFVEVAHVERVAAAAPNAEAFATHLVPTVPGGERIVPLDEAEAAIARLEQARYGRAA